jgi:hypothetical protein
MPEFDRFDICEAHYLIECDYHINGRLRERPSNVRRREATHVQLHRLGFRPGPMLSYETLTDNGRAIYDLLVGRYALPAAA